MISNDSENVGIKPSQIRDKITKIRVKFLS
jgi:hypothetical protein